MSTEQQIVQALLGLLSVVVTAGLGYFAPRLKTIVAAHLNANTAQVANHVIDGLGKIAQAVVQDFNQRVVSDAKAQGVFNAQLAAAVKQDAVNAVKSQGAALLALGQGSIGDVDGLIGSLVEHAVATYHVDPAIVQPVATTA